VAGEQCRPPGRVRSPLAFDMSAAGMRRPGLGWSVDQGLAKRGTAPKYVWQPGKHHRLVRRRSRKMEPLSQSARSEQVRQGKDCRSSEMRKHAEAGTRRGPSEVKRLIRCL
jgi:hypothetical protein